MLRNTIFGLAVAITMVLAASASDSALARDLNDALRGKEFTLRVPDAAKSIEFDSDRHRVGDAVPGDWFQHMRLQVAEVKVENQSVLLETKRVVIAFDPQKGTFSDFPSGDKLQLAFRSRNGPGRHFGTGQDLSARQHPTGSDCSQALGGMHGTSNEG